MGSLYENLVALSTATGIQMSAINYEGRRIGLVTLISNNPDIYRVEWKHDTSIGYEFFIGDIPDSAKENWLKSGFTFGY